MLNINKAQSVNDRDMISDLTGTRMKKCDLTGTGTEIIILPGPGPGPIISILPGPGPGPTIQFYRDDRDDRDGGGPMVKNGEKW